MEIEGKVLKVINHRRGAWVAIIKGTDKKYGLKREFLDATNRWESRATYKLFDDLSVGDVLDVKEGKHRYMVSIISDGDGLSLEHLDAAQVKALAARMDSERRKEEKRMRGNHGALKNSARVVGAAMIAAGIRSALFALALDLRAAGASVQKIAMTVAHAYRAATADYWSTTKSAFGFGGCLRQGWTFAKSVPAVWGY